MSEAPRLLDGLCLMGLSHHTAPVAVREKLAFRAADVTRALHELIARHFREAVILSTCNRVEVTVVGREHDPEVAGRLRKFFSEFHGVPEADFANALYTHQGADAARHLFEVTASLDSQILGETEILAQAKEAYRRSNEAGTCGQVLHSLFERSFFLSKEVRGDGGIGRTQASVSSASVALARKLFEVKGRTVLVVGTGEMATGIVRALKSAGVGELLVMSRTAARAAEFAHQEGGRPCQLAQLEEHLEHADIVLVSAAAPHYIIGPMQIEKLRPKRRGRTLCVIDISVPRNVDPEIHQFDETFLYDIDDLEEVARDGRREREAVAARWRPRLADEARAIVRELHAGGSHQTARMLIAHAEAVRLEVLKQVRLSELDPKAASEIERALERMQARLLHGPLEALKQAAREGDGTEAMAWISRLFRLQAPLLPPQADAVDSQPKKEDSKRE